MRTQIIIVLLCVTSPAWAAPEANAAMGALRVQPGVKVTLVDAQHRDLEVTGADAAVQVEPGAYRILRWSLERGDGRGGTWRLHDRAFTQYDPLIVALGRETELALGEPVRLILYKQQRGQRYDFTCRVRGQMGEPLQIVKPRAGQIPPQLHVSNQDRSFERTIDFHFG